MAPIGNKLILLYTSIILFIFSITAITGQEEHSANKNPNIIVFIADDVSWNDLGCYGNTDVQTPNIDKLASVVLIIN